MALLAEIQVLKINHSRISEVDFNNLEFGKHIADHMLVCDYGNKEWQRSQILPYANLSMSPSTLALHYGQTVFEGAKAFRMHDGRINIFRLEHHYERFVRSLERMCMAVIPKEIFIEGIRNLVALDKAWIPSLPGSALYIRPFVFASEAKFGVKVSEEYRFVVFTGPVPSVFHKPIRVKVETDFIRAAKGGTGSAKCGGNYGGSFYPTQLAKELGYDQVLWTDARYNKYIEESGFMNILFVIKDKIVTPPISDSILDGITRNSLLSLALDMGYKVEERQVSIHEIENAIRNQILTEVFGAGTAAVVAPIQTINIDGIDFNLPSYSNKNIMYKLKQRLESIRNGEERDTHGWNYIL